MTVAQRVDVLKNLYLEELRGFKAPAESELIKVVGAFTPVRASGPMFAAGGHRHDEMACAGKPCLDGGCSHRSTIAMPNGCAPCRHAIRIYTRDDKYMDTQTHTPGALDIGRYG